jgi:hypothetical protein
VPDPQPQPGIFIVVVVGGFVDMEFKKQRYSRFSMELMRKWGEMAQDPYIACGGGGISRYHHEVRKLFRSAVEVPPFTVGAGVVVCWLLVLVSIQIGE